MKYTVIDAMTPGHLTHLVAEMIEKGWKPLGGVSSWVERKLIPGYATKFDESHRLVQAMVKISTELYERVEAPDPSELGGDDE